MVPADEYEDPPDEMLAWRLTKYDRLGATQAAVTLLAHPMPEVQLEALELLKVLLLVSQGRGVELCLVLPYSSHWRPFVAITLYMIRDR